MPITKGLLIQPYASVIFGDLNLTSYDQAGTGERERLAQNISLNFSMTEDVPSCEFEIAATADGFDVVGQIRKSDGIFTEVIDVAMGYEHLPEVTLEGKFLFAGLDFTTGQDPKLKFTLTSASKSAWTENKINFSMEEGIPLSEYPAFLQEKAGKGASLMKFKFVGQAAIDAPEFMVKQVRNNQTPQQILAETCKEFGMELRHGETFIDGTVVIGYPAAKKGELATNDLVLEGKPTPGVRRIHILGPGLIENLSRKQSFTVGQSDTKGGAKSKATAASETENKRVTQNAPLPQQATAVSQPQVGVSGPSDKPQARSGIEKDSTKKFDARAAMAESLTMTLDAQFTMVPQVCGMKPGDILAIPSVKGPGDWIEDYEVESVKYSQTSEGAVMMSVSATRPYVGTENLMDEESVLKVVARVASLTTADAWNAYYWRQGPKDIAWPLAG